MFAHSDFKQNYGLLFFFDYNYVITVETKNWCFKNSYVQSCTCALMHKFTHFYLSWSNKIGVTFTFTNSNPAYAPKRPPIWHSSLQISHMVLHVNNDNSMNAGRIYMQDRSGVKKLSAIWSKVILKIVKHRTS